MSTTTSQVKPKIYHLLDNTKSSVEHYTRVNQNQRVRDDQRPNDRPFLQITYQDHEGTNRTIRFKLNCNTIFQDEQIEKLKIPANEKFTDAERNMLMFRNGVLVVTNKSAQAFLDAHPQNENFKGECPEIHGKLFKEYNPEAKTESDVKVFRRRLAAANKVAAFTTVEEAQSLLLRLYGSYYKVPGDLNDCVTQLVAFMDESDEEGIEEVLRDGKTLEDEITILIGKALQKQVISFEEPGMENFVVKKKNGNVFPLKEISATISTAERRRLFSEFLASPDGGLTLEDLRKSVGAEVKEAVAA